MESLFWKGQKSQGRIIRLECGSERMIVPSFHNIRNMWEVERIIFEFIEVVRMESSCSL
jgi:hypothetical protein